jgi:hypothetical protein
VGGAAASAAASFTVPILTGASNLTLGAARCTIGGTFNPGIFGAEAHLTFSGALFAGSCAAASPAFIADAVPLFPVLQFSAIAASQRRFNPAWVSSSKVLVSHA